MFRRTTTKFSKDYDCMLAMGWYDGGSTDNGRVIMWTNDLLLFGITNYGTPA